MAKVRTCMGKRRYNIYIYISIDRVQYILYPSMPAWLAHARQNRRIIPHQQKDHQDKSGFRLLRGKASMGNNRQSCDASL